MMNNEPAKGIYRNELQPGDALTVITKGSLYQITVHVDDKFIVTGGWFDKNDESPHKTGILGCSVDTETVNNKLICAYGLHIHFQNGVVTSPIRKVELKRQN